MSADASERPVRAVLLIALSNGAMMCLGIGINLVPVFLTTLGETFGGADGMTKEELGRLGASVLGGVTVGILFASTFADRLGIKILVLVGNAVIGASLLFLVKADEFTILCAGLGALGFGAGILDVVLSPLVAALRPDRRPAAMNRLHAFYCLGAVLAIVAGAVALRFGSGWSSTCMFLAPLPFVWVAGFLPLAFPPAAIAGRHARVRELVRRPWFRLALIAMALGGATEVGMAQWLSSFAELGLGFSRWTSAMALVAFTVAMTIGRIAIGSFGRRINPFRMLAWAGGVSAALYLVSALVPWQVFALTTCVLLGFAVCCVWPTILAIAGDRFPDAGASMFGALAAVGTVGATVMPWLIGWVAHHGSLHWGIGVTAIAPVLLLPVIGAMKTVDT